MAPTVSRSLFAEVGRAAGKMGYRSAAATDDTQAGEGRLPLEALITLLRTLEHDSGDSAIGLRLGRLLGPAAFGIAGYIAMAGPTLAAALPRVIGYQRLVADGLTLRMVSNADEIRFQLEYGSQNVPRVLSDLLMAGIRCFGAWLLGCEPPLRRITFRYRPPADTDLYHEIFGRQPEFEAEAESFNLDRRSLAAPLRTADASLGPLLEAQAARLLETLGGKDLVATVTGVIADLLPAGDVSIAAVAQALHASPRTLQRRLQTHGLTFNRLLQEMRMDLANKYLLDRRLTVQEIAERLGYQEHSSFCHAYRQWTGRAPSAVRRAAASPVGK